MSRNKFYSSQEFKFQGLWSHEEAIAHGVDVGGKTQFTSTFCLRKHRFTQTGSEREQKSNRLSVCILITKRTGEVHAEMSKGELEQAARVLLGLD